mgnify:CR=1 FL=1
MKNYVKEYKGHKVPEGATHYTESVYLLFYRKSIRKDWVYFSDTLSNWTYANISEVSLNNKVIELPEAPQEWNGEGLPPVGVECEYETSFFTINKTAKGTCSVIATHEDRVWVDFKESGEYVINLNSITFRPLKTQQEKEREAFIAEGLIAAKESVDGWGEDEATAFLEDLFNNQKNEHRF